MKSKTLDRYRSDIARQLQPGEELQDAFVAQTMNGYLAFITMWLIIFTGGYRIVVATDRRLLVFGRAKFTTALGPLLREVPRSTKIGPIPKLWTKTTSLGEKLFICKVIRSTVEAIDAAAPAV